jgi:hypothetical protein
MLHLTYLIKTTVRVHSRECTMSFSSQHSAYTPLAMVSRARIVSTLLTTATDGANSEVSSKEGAIPSQPISTRHQCVSKGNHKTLFHWLPITK